MRTRYEVKYADGTTTQTAAPAAAPKHEVRKAFVANNKEEVKTHGGIKAFTARHTYDYLIFADRILGED